MELVDQDQKKKKAFGKQRLYSPILLHGQDLPIDPLCWTVNSTNMSAKKVEQEVKICQE